jgi:polar amino acid transport system substrate-binding protein
LRRSLTTAYCGLLAGITFLAFAARGFASDEAASMPALRWGADQEGGGPYIYPRDDDPTQVVGFEVDLAQALARELNRAPVFVQCSWKEMLLELNHGKIDLAINGYEYTDQRASRYLASLPYYVYELGLCARHGDKETNSWEELRKKGENGRKKRVGVIEGSSADRYVSDRFGESCQVLRYPGSTEALRLVDDGQLDATVQDLPILHFYVQHLKRYSNLEVVDHPAAPGYYVIYSRPDDVRLMSQVNDALRKLYESGELRDIYERYSIWNDKQTELAKVWESWDTGLRENKQDRWFKLGRQIPLLVKAAGVTIALSLISMPLAIAIGVTVALVRSWGTPALGGGGAAESAIAKLVRLPFTVYVEVIRGTPLAFQLFVVYFIVSALLRKYGITLNEFWSGVIALAVNYSAYEAEIFRLGLSAVPRGQMEAALSLGMPRFLAVRRIILPQAVRLVIPATANDFIALFKDTAVCSVIAVEELSKQYSMGANSTGLFLEMAALTSILYLLMSYPLSLLAGWLERRLKGREEDRG